MTVTGRRKARTGPSAKRTRLSMRTDDDTASQEDQKPAGIPSYRKQTTSRIGETTPANCIRTERLNPVLQCGIIAQVAAGSSSSPRQTNQVRNTGRLALRGLPDPLGVGAG